MAQNQYHINQVSQELMKVLATEERATMYYMTLSHNLGVTIGELVGMGVNEGELRKSIDAIIKIAIEKRKPAEVMPPPHGRG